jgi:Tfp pilus assembly protein PilN
MEEIIDRATRLYKLLKVMLAVMGAVVTGTVTVTVWAVSRAHEIATIEKSNTALEKQLRAAQEQIDHVVVPRLAANDEAHEAIRRELVLVHADTREARQMLYEMFHGGQKSGLWGTPTTLSSPAVSARGAP